METREPNGEALPWEQLKQCPEFLRARTVPMFARRAPGDQTPSIAGTGVLLRIADDFLILTAAHVLAYRTIHSIGLYVNVGEDSTPRFLDFATDGARVIASGCYLDQDSTEPFDATAIRLSSSVGRELSRKHIAISLAEVDPLDNFEPNSDYMAYGYPAAECHPVDSETISMRGMAHAGRLAAMPSGDVEGFLPAIHVALAFDHLKCVDEEGRVVEAPDPHGISGCGIWRICEAGKNLRRWRLEDIKLVAIEQAWNTAHEFLKGTRIRWLLWAIHREFSELRRPIELHFGTSWPDFPRTRARP